MKKLFKSLALVSGIAILASVGARAQDSGALLDALVKKGVLSDQEAEEIRVDLTKDYNKTSAGKIQLSGFLNKLTLFGDARLRYQYSNIQSGTTPINNADRDRFRYRLRLGTTYTYDSHWSSTIRLETAAPNNSANVDFGRYFDKSGDGLNVGLIYLEYQNKFSIFDSTSTVDLGKQSATVTDPGVAVGVDVRAGKAPKQILLSEAFWDADTNPEGIAEEVTFSNLGVDGFSLAARAAEYFPSLPNTSNASATPYLDAAEIGSLLIGQVEGKYAWNSSSNVRVAPLFLYETKAALGGSAANNQEQSSANANGVGVASQQNYGQNPYNFLGRLAVVAAPVEVNFKLWNIQHQFWGTYGYNIAGDDRTHALGLPRESGRNQFFNVGYQIGQLKVKGDWAASLEYRYIESGAYTTNLSDSDWANNGLNQQGTRLSASYNFTDFLTGTATWMHSNPIDGGAGNNPLPGGYSYAASNTFTGASTTTTPFAGQIDIVQVDLQWKF